MRILIAGTPATVKQIRVEWTDTHVLVNGKECLRLLTAEEKQKPKSIQFRKWDLLELYLIKLKSTQSDIRQIKTSTILEN